MLQICKNKGPQCLIFHSVLNEPQAGWAAGERRSRENQELSSGTAARAGTRDSQRCKNALILPGSSPSFCHLLRYQHISLSDEFSRNSFDPPVLPARATSSQGPLLWEKNKELICESFLALQVQNLVFSLCEGAMHDGPDPNIANKY